MEFTAKQIADYIGGRVEGNEQTAVHTFAKIEEGQEGAITFLSNPKYTSYIYETNILCRPHSSECPMPTNV